MRSIPRRALRRGHLGHGHLTGRRWLAIGGTFSKSVVVWDAATGEIVHIEPLAEPEPPSDGPTAAVGPTALAFSPTGAQLAVSSQTAEGFAITVLDTSNWEVVQRLPVPVPSDNSVTFDPTGTTLIVGDWNGDITFYDTSTWEPSHSIATGTAISAMSLSPSGELLATGAEGGEVTVWDLTAGSALQTVSYDSLLIAGIEFVDDDRLLVVPYEEPIRLLALDPAELVSIGRSRVTRGFTPEECLTFELDPCPTLEEIRRDRG